jgi:hypothetical protein
MNYKKINAKRSQNLKISYLIGLSCLLLLLAFPKRGLAQHTYNGQNYTDAFSKQLVVNSTMQSNLYNGIMRASAAKRGMFPELAGASQITQQEIQNLCKPFPCTASSSSVSSAVPTTGVPAPSTRSQTESAPRQYPITATDFGPVKGRIIPDRISSSAQGTAEQKELLRQLSNQFLDGFEREGRKNNMANSFAFLVGVSLQIVMEREVSEEETDLLIAGLNNWLAVTPQFVSMAMLDKQALSESAIISAGMMAFLYEQGGLNKDARMQSDARQLAKAVIAYFFGVRIK